MRVFFLISLLTFTMQIHGQLCEGSLGDPVVEIDFGSGTGRGAALGSSITAFTNSNSGELDEGEYTIATTTSGLKRNAWHVTADHTGNSNGYMMVINSAVLANEGVFYTKTVTELCANTTYEFSAWLINVMNPSAGTDQYHPDVTFRISDTSGNLLGDYNTGDIAQTSSGTWLQYGFFFTLDNDTEVVITILNSAPSAHPGNDIALDDIAFRPCGPTVTISVENETSTSLTACENETINYTLNGGVSSGYSAPAYQWQVSSDHGTTWTDILGATSVSYTFMTSAANGTYLYRMAVAQTSDIDSINCRIVSEAVTIDVLAAPAALTGLANQNFCTTQASTIAHLVIEPNSAVWYDSPSNGNVLPNTTPLVDGTTYYAAQETVNGCESDDRYAVTISIVSPTLLVYNASDIICDSLNDGFEMVNLTNYESQFTTCTDCLFSYYTNLTDAQNELGINPIDIPSAYDWGSDTDIVYVRIDSSDNCSQFSELSITLQSSPVISIPDSIGLCENTSTTISAGSGFDSYLWSTSEETEAITASEEGAYWVTVTKYEGGLICSSTKNFSVVLSNAATISNIEIADWTNSDNIIAVYVSDTSIGDYEYSLDDINYQDSNTFSELTSGNYTTYVRDKNGCGVENQEVFLLNYPKYFTPNGDGTHDTWSITYSETEPALTTKIYDRYGKLIKQLSATSTWDGTYAGNYLPSSDYWFVVIRDNGKIHKGHFTLKR
ncbi:MAG: T9SS type B sorting domain-containing protein [Algibacter sp.]